MVTPDEQIRKGQFRDLGRVLPEELIEYGFVLNAKGFEIIYAHGESNAILYDLHGGRAIIKECLTVVKMDKPISETSPFHLPPEIHLLSCCLSLSVVFFMEMQAGETLIAKAD
jgi:hypothetical protein